MGKWEWCDIASVFGGGGRPCPKPPCRELGLRQVGKFVEYGCKRRVTSCIAGIVVVHKAGLGQPDSLPLGCLRIAGINAAHTGGPRCKSS